MRTAPSSGERPEADVVILDEAHHFVADAWGEVAKYYKDALVFGFTATPERGDGRPLGDMFTALVEAAKYSELLEGGWIVPCEIYAPQSRGGSGVHDRITRVPRRSDRAAVVR